MTACHQTLSGAPAKGCHKPNNLDVKDVFDSALSLSLSLCVCVYVFYSFRRQEFLEIMDILDKRMNDKGKNWRHVFKVRPYQWRTEKKDILFLQPQ